VITTKREGEIERCMWELMGLLYDLRVCPMAYDYDGVIKFIRRIDSATS